MRTVLFLMVVCSVVGCAERPSRATDEPDARPKADAVVTSEFLSEHGFAEPKGSPGIFSLLNVRLGDASRDLEFALSDLRRTPSQPEGSDVRTVKIRNLFFVVRARTAVVDGEPVADSLDEPDSICTISVALNQASPDREMMKKGQTPNKAIDSDKK